MRKVKAISTFAILGFLISFVFGLFSHSNFISIFLKALIFTIIFSVLGFLVTFVFSKFLDEDVSGDLASDVPTSSTHENNTKGKIVDLVIQDEELSPTQSDNNFNVGNNTFMLNSTDVNSEKLSENNAGFVPLRNFETVTNMSEKEAENPRDIISEQNKAALGEGINQQNVVDSEGNAGTIDVLPDMSYFESASENNDFSNDSGDGDNEVFGASLSVSSKKKSDSLVGEIQDTGLIAKAISSVLSEESS